MVKRTHLEPEQRKEIVEDIAKKLMPVLEKFVIEHLEKHKGQNYIPVERVEAEFNRYIHKAINAAYNSLTPRWFAKLFFSRRYAEAEED